MSRYYPTTTVRAPGETVAERLAFWRTLSWEELVAYMTPLEGDLMPRAETLTAPLVPARLGGD
jgi:hypothetical protein